MPRTVVNRRVSSKKSSSKKATSVVTEYDGKKSVAKLGAGDSYYIHNFMKKERRETFENLLSEVDFVQMFSFSNKPEPHVTPLPRMVSAQTCKDGETSAIYRMPGCNQSNINTGNWTDTVKQVCDRASEEIGQTLNHCVATLYRDADDSLAFHADKLLDLEDNSLILSVSFGAARPIVFQEINGKQKYSVVLQPGSLLAIGPKTNKRYVHAVPKLDEDVGPRISLSVRSIKTFEDKNNEITGQGEEYQTKNYPFITSYDDISQYSDEVKSQIAEFTEEADARLAAIIEEETTPETTETEIVSS